MFLFKSLNIFEIAVLIFFSDNSNIWLSSSVSIYYFFSCQWMTFSHFFSCLVMFDFMLNIVIIYWRDSGFYLHTIKVLFSSCQSVKMNVLKLHNFSSLQWAAAKIFAYIFQPPCCCFSPVSCSVVWGFEWIDMEIIYRFLSCLFLGPSFLTFSSLLFSCPRRPKLPLKDMTVSSSFLLQF